MQVWVFINVHVTEAEAEAGRGYSHQLAEGCLHPAAKHEVSSLRHVAQNKSDCNTTQPVWIASQILQEVLSWWHTLIPKTASL